MNKDIVDIEIDDIIDNLFSIEPKDKKSINLIFDNTNKEEGLFKQLLEILVKGMKQLFSKDGSTVNIQELSEDDFLKLKQYFWSFGFDVKYDINEPPINKSKNNNDLCLYYFSINTINNIKYYISFDYI